MIGYSIIAVISPVVMTAICWALFRKAGFGGGILALTFLPIFGAVVSVFLNIVLGGVALGGAVTGTMVLFMLSSLAGSAFYLAPLVVLLIKDWPARGDDDVFK